MSTIIACLMQNFRLTVLHFCSRTFATFCDFFTLYSSLVKTISSLLKTIVSGITSVFDDSYQASFVANLCIRHVMSGLSVVQLLRPSCGPSYKCYMATKLGLLGPWGGGGGGSADTLPRSKR